MCEMMDPYKSRSVRLECAEATKGKYERQNHRIENEEKMVGTIPNETFKREGESSKNTEQINVQVTV